MNGLKIRVSVSKMLEMTEEEEKCYNWALNQEFTSVAATYARTLARYIQRNIWSERRGEKDQ